MEWLFERAAIFLYGKRSVNGGEESDGADVCDAIAPVNEPTDDDQKITFLGLDAPNEAGICVGSNTI